VFQITKTKLAAIRKQKGLTQAKLGALAEIHPATISALEHRHRPCWPALRRRISLALGVPEITLFDKHGWLLVEEEEKEKGACECLR